MPRRSPPHIEQAAVDLREQGLSTTQIGTRLNLSRQTVRVILKRCEAWGDEEVRPGAVVGVDPDVTTAAVIALGAVEAWMRGESDAGEWLQSEQGMTCLELALPEEYDADVALEKLGIL